MQQPVKKKPNELDDIVDLVFHLTSDRLNEQRSPLPVFRSLPQPAADLSPLAQATTGTPKAENQRSLGKASLQHSSTDTSVSVSSVKEGGGVTPIRSRDCSPNVRAMNNSSLAPPDAPKGGVEDEGAEMRPRGTGSM